MAPASDFYLRYYVGHKGRFGHEFLEFEFRPDGQVRVFDVPQSVFGTERFSIRQGYVVCHREGRSDQDFLVQFRYANNSNYKNDTMIRKEGFVAQEILDELKRIIEDAEVHP